MESVVQLRELRKELDALRQSVADQATSAAAIHVNVAETIGLMAELLPRVEAMDTRLTELAASVTADSDSDSDDGAAGADDADTPPITPAIGWDDMDHDTARAAWEALARFVGDVLYARYRLTRLQIPDCWPLHPRLIREIAWLRSSYVDAGAMEPDLPPAAAPWHTRALPLFLANMSDAVDARECRPGIHRLTDPEVETHLTRCTKAQYEGQPEPALTAEVGLDRPRYVPEAFPTRGTGGTRGTETPNPPKVNVLQDLIVGSCEPRWWLGYYREASAADLARRPATPAPAPSAAQAGSAATGGPTTADAAPPTSEGTDRGGDERPERFRLDGNSDDLADGGPDGPGGPGGPGGLGGLDGPAGPL